jgi:hypothetical protein
MNIFTRVKPELARVTALSGFTILLFITIVNPPLSFSQGLSLTNNENDFENPKKTHDHKHSSMKAVADPFKFPMPLGGLDQERPGSVDQNRDEKSQDNNNLPSHPSTTLKHSTFKAIIIPDKRPVNNRIENTTNLSSNTNGESVAIRQSSITPIHGTNINLAVPKDDRTSQIFNLQLNGKKLPVIYQLSGSSNILLNMTMQKNTSTLLIHLASRSPGNLTVELARDLIDSKNNDLSSDGPFAVFEDGHEVSFVEKSNNNLTREISIHFDKGTSQIAIAGTHVSPEYSATTVFYGASMCISIFILLGLTRNKRLYFISQL